mgnify:CR=1 FL=1
MAWALCVFAGGPYILMERRYRMSREFLQIGEIVSTHALKGEVKVKPWCDSVDVISSLEYLYLNDGKKLINQAMKIENAKEHKGMAIIKFDGVNTVEDGAALRGKVLYARREDIQIDEDSYFIVDLIGMQVYNIDSSDLIGEIIDITPTGSNDVYHIKNAAGKINLIPALKQVVIDIDIDTKTMKIRPLEGLLDDED